jgi:hypothetical protein
MRLYGRGDDDGGERGDNDAGGDDARQVGSARHQELRLQQAESMRPASKTALRIQAEKDVPW